MAILTPLDLSAAVDLGARFGLRVTRVRGLLAGSVNSNYELALADGGRAFLRIYEEQTAASARGEARLLEHLAAHGVPTPRPMHRVDSGEAAGFIDEHAGKPVAIFPWVDGDSLCQGRLDPERTRRVGGALARVHLAGSSFPLTTRSRFGADELTRRIASLRARQLPADLPAVIDRLARSLDDVRGRPARADGVVHNDLFRDNVLWNDGEISALLDFESASAGSFPFDLMVTLLAFCFTDHLDEALARALVAGYEKERALPAEEALSLFDEGRFAATRFSITRITDFELRPRGTGIYKDFRRFIARLDELEALGKAGLLERLGLEAHRC